MTKAATAQLLETMMNDEDVVGRVSAGDFTDSAGAELTQGERDLLVAAAKDLDDDVAGFVMPTVLPT